VSIFSSFTKNVTSFIIQVQVLGNCPQAPPALMQLLDCIVACLPLLLALLAFLAIPGTPAGAQDSKGLADPKVFGQFFKGPTWVVWRAFLAALFALPMTAEQLALFSKHTGRSTPPTQPLHEAWLVCGRRAGKSFILACVAIFIACFRDWRR
jgi:hypothetical protein